MGREDILVTEKRLSYFMCDYFKEGEEIAVDCRWLQEQLRLMESLSRINQQLLDKIELQQSLLNIKQPKYRLDITV